jgi:hypothetical protein
MRYLVSGSTATLRGLLPRYACSLGFLMTPGNRNSLKTICALGIEWAADNGAYGGLDEAAFLDLLDRAAVADRWPMWVVCPDKVADAKTTLAMFDEWQPIIKDRRLPVAFVGQDGQEDLPLPWDRFACLFLGGSTEWKLSQAAADLAWEARCRGKLLHMGRVNSFKRMTTALLLGCNSVDGSSASRWGDKYIHRYARFAKGCRLQPAMF